jgi:hypothetical protein
LKWLVGYRGSRFDGWIFYFLDLPKKVATQLERSALMKKNLIRKNHNQSSWQTATLTNEKISVIVPKKIKIMV